AASPAAGQRSADVSPAFEAAMGSSGMIGMVADLRGDSIKFHRCKIGLKLSGSQTGVGYRQDFSFTSRTDDGIVTASPILDDVRAVDMLPRLRLRPTRYVALQKLDRSAPASKTQAKLEAIGRTPAGSSKE
ncbi:MAG: hypothetical protein ACRELF_19940, partial [Gemmataceae bacterium]